MKCNKNKMEYTFTEENIKLIKKFIDIRNRGYYANAKQLTSLYNEVMHTNKSVTSCGACLRGMTTTLEKALNQYEAKLKAQEALKQEEPTPIKEEAKEEPTEQKKKGRPKKEKEE